MRTPDAHTMHIIFWRKQ